MSSKEILPEGRYAVAWTPDDETGRDSGRTVGVKVGPWPKRAWWTDAYELVVTPTFVGTDQEAQYLRDIALQILLDGCSPQALLDEFSRIPAWRRMRLTDGAHAFIPGRWSEWSPHHSDTTAAYWGRDG